MRSLLLYLSRLRGLRRFMEHSRLAKPLVERFVAGMKLEEALRTCSTLHNAGMRTTLDYLGENTRTVEEAAAVRDAYLEVVERTGGCGGRPSVSLKLTQFGLDLGENLCRANVEAVVRRAHEKDVRVEIDMEAHPYVDRTLAIVRENHSRYGNVRAVIQSYLRRSGQDVESLSADGIPIRLCKGAYWAPEEVAYPEKSEVDANYSRLMRFLLEHGTFPAIATHDEKLLNEAIELIAERKIAGERYEFQMLYGVRRELQRRLVSQGYPLRLYVPFGDAWYPYFMRRLAERPANLVFLLKNLARA